MTEVSQIESYHGKLAKIYQNLIRGISTQNSRYALLDFPSHSNIGDSAIWVGQTITLEPIFSSTPIYTSDYNPDLKKIKNLLRKEDVVFLHGGGNFGDLYSKHQNMRCEVLELLSDHKVIQLPQSIHFQSVSAAKRFQLAAEKHSDFTLLVRDTESLSFAQRHFQCNVILCPDAAHCIGMTHPKSDARYEILALVREDIETFGTLDIPRLQKRGKVTDWPIMEKLSLSERIALKYLKTKGLFVSGDTSWEYRLFNYWANARLELGFSTLSLGKKVLSDRLHGNILASLLGKDHIAIDNSYGKLERYFETWGFPPNMQFVSNSTSLPDDIYYLQSNTPDGRET